MLNFLVNFVILPYFLRLHLRLLFKWQPQSCLSSTGLANWIYIQPDKMTINFLQHNLIVDPNQFYFFKYQVGLRAKVDICSLCSKPTDRNLQNTWLVHTIIIFDQQFNHFISLDGFYEHNVMVADQVDHVVCWQKWACAFVREQLSDGERDLSANDMTANIRSQTEASFSCSISLAGQK